MNNQWGRNTHRTQGGSPAGFLLAALLCLFLIGGGVYGWFVRETLQKQIGNLTKTNIELAEALTKAEAERTELASNIEALKHNTGQWAGELEQDYANLQLNEVPKLNRLLDKRDATISELEKQLDTLKKDSNVNAQKITHLETELQEAQVEAGKNTDIISDLQARAQSLAGEMDKLRSESEDLGAARSRTESFLIAAQEKAKSAELKLSALQKERIPELETALSSEKAKAAALERQLEALALLAKDPPPEPSQSESDEQPAGDAIERSPRNSAAIASLLDDQPGLSSLDDNRRRKLQNELASGACVTDALESVFDKVPLIVMRNLMRELKSDC
jgi:chromosome segregation ATPase